MRLIFMGTPDFAVKSLEALIKSKHDICSVVTIPDKAQGRGLKVKESPIKKCAKASNIPILQPEDLNSDRFANELRVLNADCFIVVAFKILPKKIFSIPPKGTINVHASLLPAYRGAAPINWAIINGETLTGVTTMLIDAKVDTGNILMQDKVSISKEMTAGELHEVLAETGAYLLNKTIDAIQNESLQPVMQDDSQATKAPKLNTDNTRINFDKPAIEIYNLVRGLSPFPGAYTFLIDKKLKIFKSQKINENITYSMPGEIIDINHDSFDVACASGALRVTELQIEGKRRMTSLDFLNGFELNQGMVLK